MKTFFSTHQISPHDHGREPHALAILDDGVARAPQIQIDVPALVDAHLPRGYYHHGVRDTRDVHGAAHAARDHDAAADVLERQARERLRGRRGRHVDHAAVQIRDAGLRGRRRSRAGRERDS